MISVIREGWDTKILRGTAFLTILCLFPAFFFYHTAIAFNVIPPVLAGFFGPVAIICGAPLILMQLLALIRHRANLITMDYIFLATIFYMITWATLNFMFGTGFQRDVPFFIYSLAAVYYWLVLHVAFRNIRLNGKYFVWVLVFFLVGMLLIALLNEKGQFFYAAQNADDAGDDVAVATYQGFARSALVVAVLLLSMSNNIKAAAITFATMILLFVLGARSEFAGFVVVSMVIMLAREGWLKMTLFWTPLLVVGVVIVVFSENVLSSNSRILQLMNISQSTSYMGREAFAEHAINTISNNFLFGDYGSHLAFGGIGSYSHNALSAWVSYGVTGFLLFVFLLLYALFKSCYILLRFRDSKNPLLVAALGFSVYGIVLAIAAKPVYDPIYAVAWGVLVAALHDRARKRYENSTLDHSAYA